MSDTPSPDAGSSADRAGAAPPNAPAAEAPTGTPRWVVRFWLVALALVLLVGLHAAVTMSPGLRKFALTVHVTTSVGWLGAVAAFLALAVAGLTSPDALLVRGAYLAMAVTTWWVIVPLSLAALVTGLVESLGTPWGLFRHHWVVAKLVLTVVATAVLLAKTGPIRAAARAAARAPLSPADLRGLRTELVVHAGGGLLVLLVVAALSVYKPKGLTRFGRAAARPLR